MNALAHDLNYPALRKNKNIEAFLNRCKSFSVLGEGEGEVSCLINTYNVVFNNIIGIYQALSTLVICKQWLLFLAKVTTRDKKYMD